MTKKHITLENLILKEVVSILKEAQPRAEAPQSSPFGKYLWADDGSGDTNNRFMYPRIRKDNAVEGNTEIEKNFLDSYIEYVSSPGLNTDFEKIISKFLRPAKNNGNYAKYISPPNKPLYRGINLDIKTASRILRLSKKELINQGDARAWYVDGGGIIKPQYNKLMSWTTNPKVAFNFSAGEDGWGRNQGSDIVIILVADPRSGGDFYLNPQNINRKFNFNKIEPLIEEESEVISFGPVNFKEAAYINLTIATHDITRSERSDIEKFIKNVASTSADVVTEFSKKTSSTFVMNDTIIKKLLHRANSKNTGLEYFINNSKYFIKYSKSFNISKDIFATAIEASLYSIRSGLVEYESIYKNVESRVNDTLENIINDISGDNIPEIKRDLFKALAIKNRK